MIHLNIAYDYDMTFEDSVNDVNPIKNDVQHHARKQVEAGHCVFIFVTQNKYWEENAEIVYKTAEKNGISKERVLFVSPRDKGKTIQEHKIDILLEDDVHDMTLIRMTTNTLVVSVYNRYNRNIDWETEMDLNILNLQKFYDRNVYLASDYCYNKVKNKIHQLLKGKLKLTHDYGCDNNESFDCENCVTNIAHQLKENLEDVGILFCSTGHKMAIAANKYAHIRAVVCWTPEIARLARKENNANVLCIPSKHLTKQDIEDIVYVFLTTYN